MEAALLRTYLALARMLSARRSSQIPIPVIATTSRTDPITTFVLGQRSCEGTAVRIRPAASTTAPAIQLTIHATQYLVVVKPRLRAMAECRTAGQRPKIPKNNDVSTVGRQLGRSRAGRPGPATGDASGTSIAVESHRRERSDWKACPHVILPCGEQDVSLGTDSAACLIQSKESGSERVA